MFAQKMQNPFLKPTPVFSANSYSRSTYNLPPSNSTKYSGYQPPERSPAYDIYSKNIEIGPQPSQPSRFRNSPDLNDILKNNPFSRPSAAIFSTSSVNAYVPGSYQTGKSYDNYQPITHQRKQSNEGYSRTRNYAGDNPNQYSQNRYTPKKHDNYLSTSSADSAATYINRIYDIDDDKSEGTSNISNPFFRKNLIGDRAVEKEVKAPNSYDNATLKFIAHKDYDRPYLEDNYVSSNKPEYGLQEVRGKAKQYTHDARNYDELDYRKNNYGQKEIQQKSYKYYEEPVPNKYEQYEKNVYQREERPNSYNPSSKYDKHHVDHQDNKYGHKYDKYDAKYDLPKETFGSKKDLYSDNYKEYDAYDAKNVQVKKFDKDDDKFDFEESGHKKSKKYIGYDAKEEFDDKSKYEREDSRENREEGYKYSFKAQPNTYSQKDIAKQSKKSERVAFQHEEDHSYQSSKYKSKEYPGNFQTLGGQPQYKFKEENYGAQRVQSKKLISSQVEQYQGHHQPHESKHENSKSKHMDRSNQYQSRFPAYEEDPQSSISRGQSKKGAVRDIQQVPKVLQYNGMVFYRVQVK